MMARTFVVAATLLAGASTVSIALNGVKETQCWDSADNMVRDQPPTGTVGSGGGNADGKTGRLGDRDGIDSGSEGNSDITSDTGSGSNFDRDAANAAKVAGIRPPGMKNC